MKATFSLPPLAAEASGIAMAMLMFGHQCQREYPA
jgi:hypothetical protein